MVSLWPWRDDTSAAGFEKTLSTLATKIAKTSSRNESLRQRSRRVKVVWTLYTGFAYILASVILTFVTGWRNWGPVEYTAVAGGPVVIWLVRMSLTSYYTYRISTTQAQLDHLYKERDTTIEKLKAATKYNSTQQLLEKYGSPQPSPQKSPSTPKRNPTSAQKQQQQQQQQQPQGPRTTMAPPPTANIQRPNPSAPFPPPSPHAQKPLPPNPPQVQPPTTEPTASFAPNAFPAPQQQQYAPTQAHPHWYDRIMDVLLGDDETLAKNRIALICGRCRLVNGQAAPGAQSAEEVGRWRCQGCGGWNGVESEVGRLVEELGRSGGGGGGERESGGAGGRRREGGSGSVGQREFGDRVGEGEEEMVEVLRGRDGLTDNEEDEAEAEDENEPPARSTRSKTRGRSRAS